MQRKDKQIETNFIDGKDTMDPDDLLFDNDCAVPLKHFDVSDFFLRSKWKNCLFDLGWQCVL